MGDDVEAQVEAWLRKKPRRVIHDQNLIELILGLSPVLAAIPVMLILYATSIYPLTIGILVLVWLIATVIYIAILALRRYYKRF